MIDVKSLNLKPFHVSLLGQACGDAYGVTFEFFPAYRIPEILPEKSTGNKSMGFAAGEITDDTDMTIITIKHLRQYKKTVPEKLKQDYYEWAKDAPDVGNQISNALFHNQYSETSQGNGALMKIIPVIVYMKDELGYDIDQTKKECRILTDITHINEEIHIINNMFVDKIYCKYNDSNYKDILKKANKTTDSIGWVYNSLRIVNCVLDKNIGFFEGFKDIIRFGGDTDTHCAIYGAYLGTLADIRDELNVFDFITADVLEEIESL